MSTPVVLASSTAGLSRRLSAVFAVLLLACCGASAWLQMHANSRHEQELTQRLSLGLASHIATHSDLVAPGGLNDAAVRALFDQLMAVNPSVEVYLLDLNGGIQAQAAPPGHLRRDHVDLAPVRRLLAGAPLPIEGDDPRGDTSRKVFSAAPLRAEGREVGFVYVVLSGEEREALSATLGSSSVLRTSLWSMALVAALGLVAGLLAFRSITRPLRRLTRAVQAFEEGGVEAFESSLAVPAAQSRPVKPKDEIATLEAAFTQMTERIATQWQALRAQDHQRRELFANISHDLRTPLTSLHGYLETLLLKSDALEAPERRRYLEIALAQSRKVSRLAQELFELARLEYGVVQPEKEHFSLPDLVQDVCQKFELAAGSRRQRLVPDAVPGLPTVTADLGMIERVLTNLLDNAIRHTPEGGQITVRLRPDANGGGVRVDVIDTGPGVAQELQDVLFTRPAFASTGPRGGGLGLMIVRRILQLHGSDIRLLPEAGQGAVFSFQLS